jgi:hypothetical protein
MTALNFPSSPTNGQVYENYVYDSTAGVWKRSVPAGTINSLEDVVISSPADEDILRYDSSEAEWVNQPLPPTVINTDGDPGTKIYVGSIDPDVSYTLEAGDIWIEV